MCCIFTCCGWMIDLIQRLWTFTMSCCISSAVCCALLTGAMSGIALGYNYSLAEYIDLKETNVSVYLKRGIFDDEIGDDMEWRRSGHQAVAGHIGEQNLRTGEFEEDSSTIRSGRRLDDSILQSDYRNQFEGSLMKLTAKAPAPTPTTLADTTIDTDKILAKYSMGSLDQMKALQSLINMRKSVDPRLKKGKEEKETPQPVLDDRYVPHGPINPSELMPGRKHMDLPPIPGMRRPPSNSARYAVPEEPLNEQAKWKLPRLPPEVFTRDELGDFDVRPTFPMPVTPRSGPVRPTRPKATAKPRPTLTAGTMPVLGREDPNYAKSIDEDMDTFKDKMLFELPSRFKEEDFMKMRGPKPDDEDYEERVKGIPVRKKRHVIFDKFKNIEITQSPTRDSSTENVKTGKKIENNVFDATKTVTTNFSSTDNPSINNSKTQSTRHSIASETFKNVEINKSSTFNSSTENPKHLDANNSSLLNRLRKSLSEFLNTSYKLRVTKNPEEFISKMSSSTTVLQILQTV